MSTTAIAMLSPDLGAVDDLCRLALVAQRLGCTVRLAGANDDVRALLDLAGMSGLLVDVQPSTNPNGTDLR